MASVFKKIICKELGEHSYDQYFECYQRLINDKKYDAKKLDNEEIYNDMYNKLKDKDIMTLKKMGKRLSSAMFLVLRISKTYKFTVIAFIAAVIFLLVYGTTLLIGSVSIGLMAVCFLYKSYEYIVNKYCFIDAHIVIVYKAVLDRLIITYELKNMQ